MNRSKHALDIRKTVKNPKQMTCSGWLAEYEIVSMLSEAEKRDNKGLRLVRGGEQSLVDMLLIEPTREQAADMPRIGCSATELLCWTEEQDKLTCLRLDVKYMSLAPGSRRLNDGLHYKFSEVCEARRNDTDFYCVLIEGVKNAFALVPRGAYDKLTDFAHGTHPLISKIPSSLNPFMIGFDDFFEAGRRLFAATRGGRFVNPASNLPLPGLRPLLRPQPPLMSAHDQHGRSFTTQCRLMQTLAQSGAITHFNPVAPLLCDFLVEIPDIPIALRVEFKLGDLHGLRGAHESSNARSPWHSQRQWHFVVASDERCDRLRLFARNEVSEKGLPRKPGGSSFVGRENVSKMIERMRELAEDAVRKADEVMRSLSTTDVSLEATVTSNFEQSELDRLVNSANVDAQEQTKKSAATPPTHAAHLPWICDDLNDQCRRAGSLICLPLDHNDPSGDYVVVQHQWKESEKHVFDQSRTLPFAIYDRQLGERDCVILRGCELTGAQTKAETPYPIGIRQSYWKRPANDRRFFILGSTVHANVAQRQRHPSTYLFLPSGFTTYHDHAPRKALDFDNRKTYLGEEYFRLADKTDDALPAPNFTRSAALAVVRGKGFLPEANSINPLRYLIDLKDGTVFKHLQEVLTGGDGELMHIRCPQSGHINRKFAKGEYRAKVTGVLADPWTCQLTRQKPRNSKK